MTRAAKELHPSSSSETSVGETDRHDGSLAARIAGTVAQIRDRARRDPEGYLRETVVPEGGE